MSYDEAMLLQQVCSLLATSCLIAHVCKMLSLVICFVIAVPLFALAALAVAGGDAVEDWCDSDCGRQWWWWQDQWWYWCPWFGFWVSEKGECWEE